MARPLKTGLDYFPLDVDFFEDDKVMLIAAEFGGAKAESLIIRLLCKIYKNGYYYQWGADQCLLMSKSIGVVECSTKWIQEVVQGLVRRCFFDEGCFNQFGILTSSAIQRRYISAIKDRKDKVEDRPFWLLSSAETPTIDENTPDNSINPPNNSINPPDNAQSKVKESKVKESKEKESESKEVDKSTTDDHTHAILLKNFDNFQKMILRDAPSVAQMREPFTFTQFATMYMRMVDLRKDVKARDKLICDIIGQMHNKASLTSDWTSAAKTFDSFLKQHLKTKQ